ncbi:PLP-dependent transferase [Hysterangium stoloniferum]|nr:PLP-dependent transferase [Hysterangium stoloniferum]
MASTLDVQYARSQFPNLESGYVFADSAGGSQALKSVADATKDYLLYSNAQLGASYPTSQRATRRVDHGADAAAVLFNADSADEIAFGSSTTQLLANLSVAMAPALRDDDEIIITGEHEANVGPWKRVAASRNLKINTWFPSSSNSKNPYAVSYNDSVPALLALVTSHTRIVALSGCSNILGEILDFVPVVRALRAKKEEVSNGGEGLWIVVDLVAFAPHRHIDVKKWDIDFAVFSFYKVYGPHTAAMYTRSSELAKIGSVAHHFHSPHYDNLPFKLQPGGAGYELTYSSSAVLPYLYRLSRSSGDLIDSEDLLRKTPRAELRSALEHTSALVQVHEDELVKTLLDYLTSSRMYERGVRVAGPESPTLRAPTISFLVIDTEGKKGLKSRDIVEYVDTKGTIGIRWGHFYAYSILASLPGFVKKPFPGTNERSIDDGIVRVSLVHYHTVAEVQKIIEALDEILTK